MLFGQFSDKTPSLWISFIPSSISIKDVWKGDWSVDSLVMCFRILRKSTVERFQKFSQLFEFHFMVNT